MSRMFKNYMNLQGSQTYPAPPVPVWRFKNYMNLQGSQTAPQQNDPGVCLRTI